MAKIMVVDDTAYMRHMLKTNLTENGHEVVAESSNSAEADLVTMDITMPEIDGIEVRALKVLSKNRLVRVA